jgi:hypothetical protein
LPIASDLSTSGALDSVGGEVKGSAWKSLVVGGSATAADSDPLISSRAARTSAVWSGKRWR